MSVLVICPGPSAQNQEAVVSILMMTISIDQYNYSRYSCICYDNFLIRLIFVGLWERGQTKQHPCPPDWRLSEGVLAAPLKNTVITETEGAFHGIVSCSLYKDCFTICFPLGILRLPRGGTLGCRILQHKSNTKKWRLCPLYRFIQCRSSIKYLVLLYV